jgi:hypothetical protein
VLQKINELRAGAPVAVRLQLLHALRVRLQLAAQHALLRLQLVLRGSTLRKL